MLRRCSDALMHKIIAASGQRHSAAPVTNVDFQAWGGSLGDLLVTMALLDRLVDSTSPGGQPARKCEQNGAAFLGLQKT